MQALKTLRDRTVTVGALAHKSNNIDHVFTLPSLRGHRYCVTAQRYIAKECVYVCMYVRIAVHACPVMVRTISGKIRGKCAIYRVTCAFPRVCETSISRTIYRGATAASAAVPN